MIPSYIKSFKYVSYMYIASSGIFICNVWRDEIYYTLKEVIFGFCVFCVRFQANYLILNYTISPIIHSSNIQEYSAQLLHYITVTCLIFYIFYNSGLTYIVLETGLEWLRVIKNYKRACANDYQIIIQNLWLITIFRLIWFAWPYIG